MAITSTNFNLTPPNHSISLLPGPYRTEPSTLEPNFLRLNSSDESEDYFSFFALDKALNNNSYASYGKPPNQFQFPPQATLSPQAAPPLDKQLEVALGAGTDYMTPEQSQSLAPVAKSLGFASAKNFVNALRYLPEDVKAKVLGGLTPGVTEAETESKITATKQMLKSESHQLLYSTFEKHGARSPQLDPPIDNDPEGMWEAPQLLALYNNFKVMEQRLPATVVKDIMEPDNGGAIIFQRKKTPERSGSEDNLLKSLSSAMKVAEADPQNNTLTLYDSAFTTNPEDIVQSKDVQSFLDDYKKLKDSSQHSGQVESVQEMLNNILPPDRKLPLTGIMDRSTVAILAEFEGQQFLKQAQDIFEDDKSLPAEDRKKHLADINQLQQDIFKDGYLNAEGNLTPHATRLFSFVQELKESTHLTPASKERLTSLVSTMENRVSTKTLNPELLERVVSNWFGIIDSGERKDFAEQVITHELGHFWESKNNIISNWKQISFQDFENEHVGESMPHTHTHDETMAPTLEIRDAKDGFASSYAKLNASEDFAESFRLFNRDPDKLIQQNLLKYMMLAGSTNTYAGDNAGLVAYAKKNGYSDKDVSAAVETLRGYQQTSETRVTDNTLPTKDQEVHLEGASAFSPTAINFSMAAPHGHNGELATPLSSGTEPRLTPATIKSANLSHEIQHSASSVGKMAQSLAFDLSVSNYFPGIEKELNIEPTYVGDPSKPGFLLDNLTNHTKNMEKFRLFSRSSRESHRFVKDFKEKGIEAFPPEIQAQIPQSIKEKFQTSDSRAIYLVMAKLRSSPELADQFSKLANDSSSQGESSSAFFEDNFGDVLEGLQVPDALKSYMSKPQNLMNVTGNGGKSLLAAETIEKNAVDVVINRQKQYSQAIGTLTDVSKGGIVGSLTSTDYLQYNTDSGFSTADYAVRFALSEVNNLLSQLGFGSQAVNMNEQQLQALSEKLVKRLNQSLPKESLSSEGWANDSATMKHINDIMLQELLQEVPALKDSLKIGATG